MKWTDLRGIGEKRILALRSAGIHQPGDLLDFAPHRWIDRRIVKPIRSIDAQGESTTVVGTVKKVQEVGFGRSKRLEVLLYDQTGIVKGVWFRGIRWVSSLVKEGDLVGFFGEVRRFGGGLSMAHPEIDLLSAPEQVERLQRIVAIYPSGKAFVDAKITSRLLSHWVGQVLDVMGPGLTDPLPLSVRSGLALPTLTDTYRMLHRPETPEEQQQAVERLKFQEFFFFEAAMVRLRSHQRRHRPGLVVASPGELTRRFFRDSLPFELTEGQKNALRDIRGDLASGVQMNRLIQGDVGAGKTVVSIGAMLMAVDEGAQAALMAPTEILAEQHARTLMGYLEPLGVRVRLLKGGQGSKLRQDVLSEIASGRTHIVVGTHAVIQEGVRFHRLGLAVIDEQHRFGVEQRSQILAKGERPHLLVMSATPIPRSLALSLYADLDVSIVRGLPAGRKPVRTAVRQEKHRPEIYGFIRETLQQGGQAYILYPLIEESEALDLKNATDGYEVVKTQFPDVEVGLLHGRMSADEKQAVMERFVAGGIGILVSTTVIEVGVDVPNASLMLIEHAERFGLSQLHQLRGRVGRGERQSYCILLHGYPISNAGRFRLKKMAETQDGFEIAEADLRLRGPGDFLGTKQSGLPEFRYGDIVQDQELLAKAKEAALGLFERDPQLSGAEVQEFRNAFEPYMRQKMTFFES